MKTIKEAAQKYVEGRWWKIVIGSLNRLNHAFTHGVKWSEKWIPINEELPPANEMIFVKREDDDGDCDYGVAYVEENRDWNVMMYRDGKEFPTHWRPMNHK